MTKIVYLVTSGERDDAEAVFSSYELAENAITQNHIDQKGRWRFNDEIDELELDPEG